MRIHSQIELIIKENKSAEGGLLLAYRQEGNIAAVQSSNRPGYYCLKVLGMFGEVGMFRQMGKWVGLEQCFTGVLTLVGLASWGLGGWKECRRWGGGQPTPQVRLVFCNVGESPTCGW